MRGIQQFRMKLHLHFKLPYVRNLGMRYPRPRMRTKKGFSCLKRVKRLHVNGRIPYGGLLSQLNAYSQILEFIQIHDFLEEIKFNFFKYSFECAEQLQQGMFCRILFKALLFSPVLDNVGQAGQLQNGMRDLSKQIVVER